MKNFKKVLVSLVVASALAGAASPVFADLDSGRITYAPEQAIDMVAGKVKTAIDALTSGGDKESVAKLIKDALDASKEINANDKVDRNRSKANNKLKAARDNLLKDNATQEAEQSLRDAYKIFTDLKSLL